jgi:hypothetical protein
LYPIPVRSRAAGRESWNCENIEPGFPLLVPEYRAWPLFRAAAHYRWTSYRANALGVADSRITPHALYRDLGANGQERRAAYRALFGAEMERAALDDIRLALVQNQPLGNVRF